MIQKNFCKVVMVMSSSLCVSGVLAHAQATNTTPNQRIVTNPLQIALQSAAQNPQNTTPNTPTQNTAPTTRQQRANRTQRAPASAVQVPQEFNPGIAALQSAKSALDTAGDKWGRHRVAAIRLINKALNACGQKQTPNPAEMKSGPQDDPAALQQGVTQLTSAKNDFQNIQNNWGGRRAKAIALIDQALQELQAAMSYQQSHSIQPAAQKRK